MKFIHKKELPVGAISTEEIDRIYLNRRLEEGGQEELIPILNVIAKGQRLEEKGHLKEARELYLGSLKQNPENPWLIDALSRIKFTLN